MPITGLDKAISRLRTKFVRIENAIQDEIIHTGEAIRRDAGQLASQVGFFDDYGNWVELNGKVKGQGQNDGTGYKIWVDAGKMGAYIEFGTGEFAKNTLSAYNEEWRTIAYNFFVNGEGKLPARPYMYPAWVKNTTGLLDRLRQKMKKP